MSIEEAEAEVVKAWELYRRVHLDAKELESSRWPLDDKESILWAARIAAMKEYLVSYAESIGDPLFANLRFLSPEDNV